MGTSASDHADIQAIVKGFGYRYPVARYSMLRLSESAQANQQFLQQLPEALDIPEIPTSIATLNSYAQHDDPPTAITVGLSFTGLAKLGVNSKTLRSFPPEFCEGMAARAAMNSDTGSSAPDQWEPFWSDGVDLVLGILAGSAAAVDLTHQRLRAFLEQNAEAGSITQSIVEVGADQGQRMYGPEQDGHPRPIEHFGFRDGVSITPIEGLVDAGSPKIKGAGRLDEAGDWHAIAAGEFLYGYTDEIGEIPTAPQPATIARNGTFLVYRKLQQNVEVFQRYVQQLAEELELDADTIAAKIVGRNHDGVPMVADTNGINDFDYSADPRGRQCPLGSHVRRTNPRDSLGFQSLLVDRHRMARRGITYGRPFDESAAGDRGLLFLALNVDIGRQFEFVQREWVNFGNDFDQGADRDPLTGSHGPDGGQMTFHYNKANPVVAAKALPRFVDTRGGEYFFVPGCDGYRRVSEGNFG